MRNILDAGCDILGGESCPEVILDLVARGAVSEQRLDESVRRILRDKFRLGLFDDPYVDPAAAGAATRHAPARRRQAHGLSPGVPKRMWESSR